MQQLIKKGLAMQLTGRKFCDEFNFKYKYDFHHGRSLICMKNKAGDSVCLHKQFNDSVRGKIATKIERVELSSRDLVL